MKRIVFLLSAVCLLLMTACDIETSSNGDLDGYWHLQQIDSLSNNKVCDYGNQRIFWSIQSDLLQLWNLEDQPIICQFTHENGVLTIKNPCMFDRSAGDTMITDVEVLKSYGVNAIPAVFQVVSLNSESMVLESPLLRLYFNKH